MKTAGLRTAPRIIGLASCAPRLSAANVVYASSPCRAAEATESATRLPRPSVRGATTSDLTSAFAVDAGISSARSELARSAAANAPARPTAEGCCAAARLGTLTRSAAKLTVTNERCIDILRESRRRIAPTGVLLSYIDASSLARSVRSSPEITYQRSCGPNTGGPDALDWHRPRRIVGALTVPSSNRVD